jgi:hypothetical protein
VAQTTGHSIPRILEMAQIFLGFREPGVHDAVTPKSCLLCFPNPKILKRAQRLWLVLFPLNVFGASRFRESGLHVSRILASRPPRVSK